ncbi:MAG: ROK family protein [Bacteroidales bacterium]|jgi:predicted NBD/HSP70 family sugar kinase|nr:ROK family protein [Bacteroidales bacterium]MBQ2543546.1 ROK family protein [Bacteroidales bacterium]MBQ3941649.1 ROK family protein [Bacteroidales bacterium]
MTNTFLNDDSSKSALAKREILRLCITHEESSISFFSKTLGISVPTVTKLISELKEDGFILDEGKIGTSGGRRPSIFGLNPNAGYFVGIDVARHHFHIAITDFKGNMLKYIEDIEFVLESNSGSFRQMCRMVQDNVVAAGIPWIKVLAAGVSLSGRVNPEQGYSLTYFVSDDLPLKDLFQRELNVPVSIENDSRALTYGEYMYLGKNANKDMIAINLSWGLGMGMILDGHLYYGKSGFSGEIGHFPLLDNNIMCRCGKVGCLETGASGSALRRIIVEKLKAGRRSSLSKIYKENGNLDLSEILQAVQDGDVLAIECIGEIGEMLGRGIAGVINIFNPGLVIIGGRLIVGKDHLLLPVRTVVNKYSMARVASDTKIRLSTLGRKATVLGDCLLARKKLLGI